MADNLQFSYYYSLQNKESVNVQVERMFAIQYASPCGAVWYFSWILHQLCSLIALLALFRHFLKADRTHCFVSS